MMKIRKLTPDDHKAFRRLRLEALRDSPAAFGSDYEREAAFSPEKFCRGLQPDGENREAFVLGAWTEDNGDLIGMAGFYSPRREKTKHKAWIWGMYVAPGNRGQGAGKELLTATLDRAKDLDNLEQIHLSVVATNEGARNLYEAFGFIEYGREPSSLKVNGVNYDECFLCLKLKT